MFGSLKKSADAYKKHPFIFIWGSLVYLLMLVVFFLAALGFFLVYFIVSALIDIPVDINTLPTQIVIGLILFAFIYFLNGLTAGLTMTYHDALTKNKTSLADFYGFALRVAPTMFEIMLIREILSVLVIAPVLAVYYYFLQDIAYMDYLFYIYVLFCLFMLHFIFTPAFISGGALGTGLFASLKRAFHVLRRRHVNYLGLFILFAIVWFLNFVPLVQLLTLFFVYPLVYTGLIVLVETTASSDK